MKIAPRAPISEEFVAALREIYTARLEDYAFVARRPSFDFVLCRAVALEERYVPPLRRLLKPGGMAVFYKAQKLDDLAALKHEVLWETKDPDLGLRKLIGIIQKDLMMR